MVEDGDKGKESKVTQEEKKENECSNFENYELLYVILYSKFQTQSYVGPKRKIIYCYLRKKRKKKRKEENQKNK